jgi:putative flippase GtrA
MSATRPLSVKIARFAVVGVANSAIDLGAFSVLVLLSAPPLAANAAAWLTAVAFSYVANSRWSFERRRDTAESANAAVFLILSGLISLGSSSLALLGLAETVGVFPAKIIGMTLGAALSFLAARWAIESFSARRRS